MSWRLVRFTLLTVALMALISGGYALLVTRAQTQSQIARTRTRYAGIAASTAYEDWLLYADKDPASLTESIAETLRLGDASGLYILRGSTATYLQGNVGPVRVESLLTQPTEIETVEYTQQDGWEFYLVRQSEGYARRSVAFVFAPQSGQNVVLLSLAVITLLGAVVIGSLSSIAARRWFVQPLATLAAQMKVAAEQLTQGDMSALGQAQVIPAGEVPELQSLRQTYGILSEHVKSYAQSMSDANRALEQRSAELEQLNRNWQTTSRQAERRAMQLAASAQVARAIGQVRDLDQLLAQVSQLISTAFGHYHIGIFINDEIGRFAVLRAANSEGGQRMLEHGYKLPLDTANVIGQVIRTGQSHAVMDVKSEANYLDNADLPNTRSEAICPLRVGQQIFGALDVHSAQNAAFAEEDMVALNSLADQIAIAIENARLFTQTQAALQEAEETQRRYMQEQWETLLPSLRTSGYEYHASSLPAIGDLSTPEFAQALQQGDIALGNQAGAAEAMPAMAVPIKLRDEVIGVIDLQDIDLERKWTEDDVAFVSAVADQAALALENARLFMQTQQRARREQLIAQIAAKMRAAPDTEGVMRTAVQEIRRVLGASHGIIRLGTEMQDEH